jgi:hypothetical protein
MHAFNSDRQARTAPPRPLPLLDAIQIARPCPADWEAMAAVAGQAADRVRHCAQCNLRVYNLSALARQDAEQLIHQSEGRLCVRLYRREDGTVLTQDCSWFRRAAKATEAGARRAAWAAACGLAFLMGSAVWAGSLLRDADGDPSDGFVARGFEAIGRIGPLDRIVTWIYPTPPQAAPMGKWIAGGMPPPLMGDIAMPIVPPPPSTPPQQWLTEEHRQPPL